MCEVLISDFFVRLCTGSLYSVTPCTRFQENQEKYLAVSKKRLVFGIMHMNTHQNTVYSQNTFRVHNCRVWLFETSSFVRCPQHLFSYLPLTMWWRFPDTLERNQGSDNLSRSCRIDSDKKMVGVCPTVLRYRTRDKSISVPGGIKTSLYSLPQTPHHHSSLGMCGLIGHHVCPSKSRR